MRIVCIASSRVPSETANSIQVMKVCQAFKQLGHDLTLLVPGVHPEALNLEQHYGLTTLFPVEWLPTRNRRWFPWKAILRARALKPDLVYAWPLQSAVLGLVMGFRSMVELHDFPGGAFGPLWLKLIRLLPGRKRLLPITDALRRALNLPENFTVIAPDGVDLERYSGLPDAGGARRMLGFPEAPTVLCTGHLYEGRGADLFLRLAARFPEASFVWVGGREEDVEAWKVRSGSVKNVVFTGFISNERIPLYQAAGDVLMMPYGRIVATSSGGNTAAVASPMKMFEYMATGRAILTSDLPVLREVLDDSMAVFCPPGDEQAWASALGDLLKDENRRLALGQRACQAVQAYSWTERARRVLQGFEK